MSLSPHGCRKRSATDNIAYLRINENRARARTVEQEPRAANNWRVTHTRFAKTNASGIRIAFLPLRAVPVEADRRATRMRSDVPVVQDTAVRARSTFPTLKALFARQARNL